MARILVTNDDGLYSSGLEILYKAVRELGEVYVVVPETPKSASGLGITLHKPLRVSRVKFLDTYAFLLNGTPSDVIYMALKVLAGPIDLVVSGVNIGDNTSIQVILSSGTVGAAAQASLEGIPAIALSAAVKDGSTLATNDRLAYTMETCIRALVKEVLEKRLPKGVDLLNVNFPDTPTKRFKLARPARVRFINIIEERKDPRGGTYYWLYGEPVEPEEGTDVYTVLVEKEIAVTPISLSFYILDSREVVEFIEKVNERLGEKNL
ncbi:MAG: 5'/3'-nucleotidase SurE [Thermoprotei archaeon]|nr:MAG: 5'/3'-nucleotidase SurE [Thermoprotei archaeon]